MVRFGIGKWFARLGLLGTVLGLAALTAPAATEQAAKAPAAPKFIGAAKCKNCHNDPHTGEQWAKWKEAKHSKAFATLAGPEALKAGKERGVDEPQKSEKCLKCHTTGFGLPPERFSKGFAISEGVQCETCHGPGEAHLKARMAAAAAMPEDAGAADKVPERMVIPVTEITARPKLETCLGCHNSESPSFKPFCYKHRIREISHDDPRKRRTQAELDAMKCGCGDACKCNAGECGEPSDGH